jgi:hypothetical protein
MERISGHVKNPKQLEADELLCPHCQSSNVQPIQVDLAKLQSRANVHPKKHYPD